MYELTGYTVDELNHISPLTLIHPEELPFVEKLLKQIHTGTIEKKPYTIRIITKSGEEKTIHFTFNIISYQGEKSLLLIIRDITKQQKMQQEVEKSHRRYHSLFNNMTDGILYCEVLADEKGNVDNFIVLDANPAYERMTGLKKNKIIGKAITEFSPSTRAADYWKEMYYRAIETAESQKYQFYSTSLGKWIDLSLYSPDEGYVVLIHTDVTERKKNEAELQKLSFAVEQNPASIVITDAAGHIEYVNKKFTELTGYTFTEALGKTPGILNSDAHTQGFYAELWRTILSGKIWEGEIRNKKKNGELYWERAQIAPITDKSGNISHFVAIKEDITEKKAIQQELLLKDNAIANSINAIAFANLEGKITYVNDSFLKLWQFENRDEVLGTTLSRFWISEQSAKLVWDKMLMKGGWIGEVESQKQDGSPLHLAVSASIIYDIETSPIAIMASFMDVTQQKTAQDALKHSEEQLRTIIEKTPIGMCVTDEKGIFEYVNPAYCDFYGYAPSELIGRHFTIVVPEESRNFMSRLHDDFLFHGKEMRGEWEVITHDRKIKHILADAARITARDGKYRKVTFVLDITAIKEKEEETRQLMKKLQISNKELQQFAYAASHDLKEPLRMVTGYLELLKRKYQHQLDADADEFIYFAVDGARRMRDLINALLQYSRIQTKGREFKPVDMNRVLKETLQNLKVSIEETKAEINFPDLPLVKGDEIQLVQLLQNLIGNAIKYRKPGIPPEIEISYEKEEGKIRFCVKDNGIGIAPEFQERVFQIFQRLHTHEEYEGIGIGLSICQKIAERHGGKIGVLSAAGEGSAFYFSLPAENKKEKSA
jgi:PAS domain S-box-containing protein